MCKMDLADRFKNLVTSGSGSRRHTSDSSSRKHRRSSDADQISTPRKRRSRASSPGPTSSQPQTQPQTQTQYTSPPRRVSWATTERVIPPPRLIDTTVGITGGRIKVVGERDTMAKGTDAPKVDDSEDRATSVAATESSVPGTAHTGGELSADGANDAFTRRSSLVDSDPRPRSRSNTISRRSSSAASSVKAPPRSRPASPVAIWHDNFLKLPLRSDLPRTPRASQTGGQTLETPSESPHERHQSTSSECSQSSGCSKMEDTTPHPHLPSPLEISMSPSESASDSQRTPSPKASRHAPRYLAVEVVESSLDDLRKATRQRVAARRQASAQAAKGGPKVGPSIAVTDGATQAVSDTGSWKREVRRPSPGLSGKQCSNTTSTLARIAEFYQKSASGPVKPSDLFGDMSLSQERALASTYLGQRSVPSISTPGSHIEVVSTLEDWDRYVAQESDSCEGTMRWAYDDGVLLPSIAKDWERSARQTHAAATQRLHRDWDRQTAWMVQAGQLSASDMIARRSAYLGWLDGRFATDDSHLLRRTSNHVSFAEQVESEASSGTVGPG